MTNALKYFTILILLCFWAIPLSAQMRNLYLQGYRIDTIYPISFSSFSFSAHLQIRNDTTDFAMSRISGIVFLEKELFAEGSVSDIYLSSGDNSIYIKGQCTIHPTVPFLSLIRIVRHPDISKLSANAAMVVRFPSGEIKSVNKQNVPLHSLIGNLNSTQAIE